LREPSLADVLKGAKVIEIDEAWAGSNRQRIIERWIAEVLICQLGECYRHLAINGRRAHAGFTRFNFILEGTYRPRKLLAFVGAHAPGRHALSPLITLAWTR
jgi:hypothetical protein